MAWEDAVNLVVERVKKQGIGFNGYSAAGNEDSDLIALYFELPEEALFLEAVVDRVGGDVKMTVTDVKDKFWTGDELSWLPKRGRTKTRVVQPSEAWFGTTHRLRIRELP